MALKVKAKKQLIKAWATEGNQGGKTGGGGGDDSPIDDD